MTLTNDTEYFLHIGVSRANERLIRDMLRASARRELPPMYVEDDKWEDWGEVAEARDALHVMFLIEGDASEAFAVLTTIAKEYVFEPMSSEHQRYTVAVVTTKVDWTKPVLEIVAPIHG